MSQAPSSLTRFYSGAVLFLVLWLLIKIRLPGTFPFTPDVPHSATTTTTTNNNNKFYIPEVVNKMSTDQPPSAAMTSDLAAEGAATATKATAQEAEVKPTVEDDGRRAVVFMHGLGDRGSSWSDLAQLLGLASLPGVTWHFPDSPLQAVSVNSGSVMPSWFDIYNIPITASTPDDESSLVAATKSVLAYVDTLDVPREQVILGGFSQGAAMSLLTALESDRSFAGVIMLSGWAPMRNKLKQVFVRDSTAHVGTKVFHGHGTNDNVVLFKLAQTSAAVMAAEGMDVTFTAYPSMQHSSCAREMRDLSHWLAEIIKAPVKQ